MSRGSVISIVAVAALLVGGLALAFQEQNPSPGERVPFVLSGSDWVVSDQGSLPVPPSPIWVLGGGGDATVMLEEKTGRTWVLHRSHGGTAMWLPAIRIDDGGEARKYLQEDKEAAAKAKAEKRKPRAE